MVIIFVLAVTFIYAKLMILPVLTYQQKIKSYAEKQSLILAGKVGRSNLSYLEEKTLPFEKLTVVELKYELRCRNIDAKGFKNTWKDLTPLLKKVLRGAIRMPFCY